MRSRPHCERHSEFHALCQACKIECEKAGIQIAPLPPRNIDPNDVARRAGLEAVDAAFQQRRKIASGEADGGNGPEDEAPALLPTLDLASLANAPAKPRAFAIERIAPLGEVTMLFGPGSGGKSLLGQQMATAAAAGLGQCLGLAINETPAIYLTCEDDAQELHWRQERLCEAAALSLPELHGKLHLVSLRGELGNELAQFASDGRMTVTGTFARLSRTIREVSAKLTILDNVAHLFTGNENDRADVTRFVNLLNRLAGETGAAIILIGHPNKAGDEWSGSTAWNNAVRSRLYLEHDEDSDLRTLSLPKANYSQKGQIVSFRWHNGAFARDQDIPSDLRAELAQTAKANSENAAFLRCLAAATEKKRAVSHNPGSNYAPKIFAGMPESKSYTQKAFKEAMERLLHLGVIELDQPLWRGSNRVMKQGIKLAAECTNPPAQTPCTDLHETPGNPARFNPPIYEYMDGAASQAAAPLNKEGEA